MPPTLLLAAVLAAAPQAPQPQADPAAILTDAARSGFSGLAWATRDGKIVLTRSAGSVSRDRREPFSDSTAYAIGSVSKQFTRAAILLLEQDGRLATTDSLATFFPTLPADKRPITIQQLLDMSAGFHEYHDREEDSIPADHQRMSRDEAFQRIAAQPLLFPPGTGREYSNSGYTLLAMVVEQVTAAPFRQFVRQRLLDPAGMAETGFFGEPRWNGHTVARGRGPLQYLDNAPERWPEPSWVILGAGGMVSTTRDLARWVGALRGGRILDAAHLRKHYPQGGSALYAGGSDFGNETIVMEFADGKDLLILHSNSGLGHMALAGRLAEAVRGEPLPERMRAAVEGEGGGPGGGGGDQVVIRGGPGEGPGGESNAPGPVVIRAFLAALRDGSREALTRFVNQYFTEEFRAAFPMDAHLEVLTDLAGALRRSQRLTVQPGDGGPEITIAGEQTMVVALTVAPGNPPRITRMGVRDQ